MMPPRRTDMISMEKIGPLGAPIQQHRHPFPITRAMHSSEVEEEEQEEEEKSQNVIHPKAHKQRRTLQRSGLQGPAD